MSRFVWCLALGWCWCAATSAEALERLSVRSDQDLESSEWRASTTATISYYNICNGWLWTWNVYDPSRQSGYGVCYDTGAPEALLTATRELLVQPMPAGYGYTGVIEVLDGCDCNAQVLASQLHVGGSRSGSDRYSLQWIERNWMVTVPQEFMVRIRGGAQGYSAPWEYLAFDHPAAGPTGLPGAGVCYPEDREPRSFRFDFSSGCTWTPLMDGVGAAEAIIEVFIDSSVLVENSSWGQVKALYR